MTCQTVSWPGPVAGQPGDRDVNCPGQEIAQPSELSKLFAAVSIITA